MSHISTIEVCITDLDALESAVKALGGRLVRGKKTYNWYGEVVNSRRTPKNIDKSKLGTCEHAIEFPGINYSIGVVPMAGGGFTLAMDSWGGNNDGGAFSIYHGPQYGGPHRHDRDWIHDGVALEQKVGKDCGLLVAHYGYAKTVKLAQRRGLPVRKAVLPDGRVQARIQVR